VFVDKDMPSADLVLRDVGERFHAAGLFAAGSIQSYIVANPDALFITDKENRIRAVQFEENVLTVSRLSRS